VANWGTARPDASVAISTLLADNEDLDENTDLSMSLGEDCIRISPPLLANIDTASAAALGLPPPTNLALDLRAQSRIDEDGFRVNVRWVRPGGQPIRSQLKGALLYTDAGARRVPEPLWSLYRA